MEYLEAKIGDSFDKHAKARRLLYHSPGDRHMGPWNLQELSNVHAKVEELSGPQHWIWWRAHAPREIPNFTLSVITLQPKSKILVEVPATFLRHGKLQDQKSTREDFQPDFTNGNSTCFSMLRMFQNPLTCPTKKRPFQKLPRLGMVGCCHRIGLIRPKLTYWSYWETLFATASPNIRLTTFIIQC